MPEITPIGTIRSIFREKFGIPRQSGLCPTVRGQVVLPKTDFNIEALKDLEDYSHIWIIFQFHQLKKSPDKAKIRPPRLGGNKYVGVYSSRSPYRPNSLGMSLVELDKVEISNGEIRVHISNHDLLDGTPVFDIKPFVSTDIPSKSPDFGWQQTEWQKLEIEFCNNINADKKLKKLIKDLLKEDPRPAYEKKKDDKKKYYIIVDQWEITFTVSSQVCTVIDITSVKK